MSIEIVDNKVREQIDQIADMKKLVSAYMKTIMANTESGAPVADEYPTFWYTVDSTGDQDYENTIKGESLTLIDQALLGGLNLGSTMSEWFNLHESYFQLKRNYGNGFSGWLDENHYRVSSDFNLVYEEARGISLDPRYVYLDNDDDSYTLASIAGTTYTYPNSGILPEFIGDTRLAVKVSSGTASANTIMTLVLTDQTDETTRSIDVSISSGMTTSQEIIVGEVTPSVITVGAINTTLTVPNISNFKSNTYAFIRNVSTNENDYILISEVTPTSGGSGTIVVPNLKLTTSPTSNIRVSPAFYGVSSVSMSVSAGNFKVFPKSDRSINND